MHNSKLPSQGIKIYLAPNSTAFHGMIIYYQTKDSKFHTDKVDDPGNRMS